MKREVSVWKRGFCMREQAKSRRTNVALWRQHTNTFLLRILSSLRHGKQEEGDKPLVQWIGPERVRIWLPQRISYQEKIFIYRSP